MCDVRLPSTVFQCFHPNTDIWRSTIDPGHSMEGRDVLPAGPVRESLWSRSSFIPTWHSTVFKFAPFLITRLYPVTRKTNRNPCAVAMGSTTELFSDTESPPLTLRQSRAPTAAAVGLATGAVSAAEIQQCLLLQRTSVTLKGKDCKGSVSSAARILKLQLYW